MDKFNGASSQLLLPMLLKHGLQFPSRQHHASPAYTQNLILVCIMTISLPKTQHEYDTNLLKAFHDNKQMVL